MIWLFALLFCIVMVFVFSAFETGYILCQRKDFAGITRSYRRFLLDVEEVITTVLVGLNFFAAASSILAFWSLKSFGIETAKAIGISGLFISILLLLTEFFAKNFARERSSLVVKLFVPFIVAISYLAVPVNKLILFLIFPIRMIKGERKKEAVEVIKLLVSESVRDGELDSERARLVLFFSRWRELKLKEFAEPIEGFAVEAKELLGGTFKINGPVLIFEEGKVLGLLDMKKFLLSRDLKASIIPIPVLSGDLSIDTAIGKLKEAGSKLCLVDMGNKYMLFRFSQFLKIMVEG